MDDLFVENPNLEEMNNPEVSAEADLTEMDCFDLNCEGIMEDKPKRNGKVIAVVAAAVAVVALLVGLAIAFWNPILNLLGLSEKSPRDQFVYVEVQATSDLTDGISALYGEFLLNLENGMFADQTEVKFALGDDLRNELGSELDIAWLDGLELCVNRATDMKNTQITLTLCLQNIDLISMDIIYDMQNNGVMIGLPGMSDTYAYNIEGDGQTPPVMDQETIDALLEALPSEQMVNKLLRKYIKTAWSGIKDVTRTTESITIDGVTQKCTKLETKLNANVCADMCIAVLNEAKNDDDLYAVVEQFVQFALPDEEMPGGMQWVSAVDSAIVYLNQQKETYDQSTYILWTDYVDSKDRLIGRAMKNSETDEVVRYVKVKKGNSFAFEMNSDDMLVLSGSGTDKGNRINGEFSLLTSGVEMISFELIDFDSKKLDNGELSGTVRAKISPLVMQLIFQSPVNADMAIDFVFDDKTTDSGLGVYFLLENEMVAGCGIDMSTVEEYSIEIPQKLVDVNDEQALQEWIDSWDVDQLEKNLEQAGVNAMWIEAIVQYMEELVS